MEAWKVPSVRYTDVEIASDQAATMRDGVKLYADIYRPVCDEKLPVLLMRTPYDKRTVQNCVYLDTLWYARYGYIVVVQDCRGRWRSDGDWYPYRHESADSEDTIKWAAALPGSNGEVAMYGFSYPGSIQLLAASKNLPELKTIMPAMTSCSFYSPWTYEGGALSQGFIQSWALSLGRDTALRAGDVGAFKKMLGILGQYSSYCYTTPLNALMEEFRQYIPYYFDWIENESYNDYWREHCVNERYDDINLPVFHVGGWYDVFLRGTIQNFIELESRRAADNSRGRQKLLVGPWHHVPWQPKVGCVNFGAEAENIVDLAQLAWLDQHMRSDGGSSKPGADHNVSVFVLGANSWAHFDSWPPKQAKTQSLYLHSQGRASSTAGDGSLSLEKAENEPWDSFVYDPTIPVASLGGHSCCFDQLLPMGACDQGPNQMRNDVLVFTSKVLEKDVTVCGAVKVEIHVSTSAVDTDFTATLSDVDLAGRAINICNGIIRMSRQDPSAEPELVKPGQIYKLEIDLGWTAAMFKVGHRIRLDISSSNFPHYDRNVNTGDRFSDLQDFLPARQMLYHDAKHPSALHIQVV